FLPGGGIEGEESPQDCITRECMEDLALEVKIGSHICNVDLFHQSDKTRLFYHSMGEFYFTKLLKQLDQPSEEDHILVWMNADEAVNNLRLESQSWAVSKALKMNKEIV
ncbi:NUDIX domain-containing protein, partial [Armatimonadetes bacterium]|nr:NUDIX domain-containing protein [bacterium]